MFGIGGEGALDQVAGLGIPFAIAGHDIGVGPIGQRRRIQLLQRIGLGKGIGCLAMLAQFEISAREQRPAFAIARILGQLVGQALGHDLQVAAATGLLTIRRQTGHRRHGRHRRCGRSAADPGRIAEPEVKAACGSSQCSGQQPAPGTRPARIGIDSRLGDRYRFRRLCRRRQQLGMQRGLPTFEFFCSDLARGACQKQFAQGLADIGHVSSSIGECLK